MGRMTSPVGDSIQHDRALGALYGLAIGDALGMPVQGFGRARAAAVLGTPPDFRDAPEDNRISRGLRAGSITDDTMQAVLLATLLIEGDGVIAPERMARALLEWERDMQRRGLSELLGPSTKRAVEGIAAGEDPSMTGRAGTTNGAAMRITPVGVATAAEPLSRLVAAVVAANRATHDTGAAHAGAAVVATVVSVGIDGGTFAEAARLAIGAARAFGWEAVFVDALRAESEDDLVEKFGTGVETVESVPTAFGVAALHPDDPWLAASIAASLGGDTDTMAALAGAMVGACTGLAALPDVAVRRVSELNDLALEPLARKLLALRNR
jgi:ADP-ribosylglycohydrolase